MAEMTQTDLLNIIQKWRIIRDIPDEEVFQLLNICQRDLRENILSLSNKLKENDILNDDELDTFVKTSAELMFEISMRSFIIGLEYHDKLVNIIATKNSLPKFTEESFDTSVVFKKIVQRWKDSPYMPSDRSWELLKYADSGLPDFVGLLFAEIEKAGLVSASELEEMRKGFIKSMGLFVISVWFICLEQTMDKT